MAYQIVDAKWDCGWGTRWWMVYQIGVVYHLGYQSASTSIWLHWAAWNINESPKWNSSLSKPPPMLVDTSVSMCIEKARLPCWPLYSQDHTSEIACKGSPWFWNPGQTSPEVQNRGISGPTKRTYVLKIFLKKFFTPWYLIPRVFKIKHIMCTVCHK